MANITLETALDAFDATDLVGVSDTQKNVLQQAAETLALGPDVDTLEKVETTLSQIESVQNASGVIDKYATSASAAQGAIENVTDATSAAQGAIKKATDTVSLKEMENSLKTFDPGKARLEQINTSRLCLNQLFFCL